MSQENQENSKYQVAFNFNNLWVTLYKAKKFKQAEEKYLAAVNIMKEINYINHPDYPIFLNNLWFLYKAVWNLQLAINYFEDSVNFLKQIYWESNQYYKVYLRDTASVYADWWLYEKALDYYKKIVTLTEELWQTDEPWYDLDLNDIWLMYYYLGDFVNAEIYYKKAIDISDSKDEFDNNLPVYISNLALLYREKEDYNSSEIHYNWTLELVKKYMWENNEQYFRVFEDMVLLNRKKWDFAKAKELRTQCMNEYRAAFPDDYIWYARYLNNLWLLYQDILNYDEAERYVKESLWLYEKNQMQKDPQYSFYMKNLAKLYELVDLDKAEKVYKDIIYLSKAVNWKDSPYTIWYVNDIVTFYSNNWMEDKIDRILEENNL